MNMVFQDTLLMMLLILPLFWIIVALLIWAGIRLRKLIEKETGAGKSLLPPGLFLALVITLFWNKYQDKTYNKLIWTLRPLIVIFLAALIYLKV